MAGRGRPRRPPPPDAGAATLDWLALVEPDGAFLTPTLLKSVFPHGFDPLDRDRRAELRSRVNALTGPADAPAFRDWFLRTLLEWGDELVDGPDLSSRLHVTVPEHGVTLRPDAGLRDVVDTDRLRLGLFVWPPGTALTRRPDPAPDAWAASPQQRAEKWCREAGVPLALVTDDDTWMLVWAPRGGSSASCWFRLADVADERILQAGLISLLHARRFFAVPDDPSSGETLERLFERAANADVEITKGLGRQVRRAVELLVSAISRDHVESGQQLLASVSDDELYEAGVTVLMRLVFLLYAEERRLLPSEDPLWADAYSVLALRDQLRQDSLRDGVDAMDRRTWAWHRLLATFRGVHGGIHHDRLRLPAYGGALFDPERFAFLEGRHVSGTGRPVGVDDHTVLAILDGLLTVEVGSGARRTAQRLSYRTLDVEQIGHCYEGLLDHGCASVDVLAAGLVGPEGNEPEISIDDLQRRLANSIDELVEWLAEKERCAKSASELTRLLAKRPEGIEVARLRTACGSDDAALARLTPFWGLIRTDLRGLPTVYLAGSKMVTQTSTRRNTGAQYTNRALADEVVRHALEPLVYSPGPTDEPDPARWVLLPPGELLGLRVCDPAVGSGAILTAACRYLATRLVEAVVEHGPGSGPSAERLAELGVAGTDEQPVIARREVVDHCLYGVDKNPVAAEMAKLSLWLSTMARERPFTFLDHAIQVGDSLLGITDVDQLRWLHLDPSARRGARGFETLAIDTCLKEAAELARQLQQRSVLTIRDAADKQRLDDELGRSLADLNTVADVVVGAALNTSAKSTRTTFENRLASELDRIRVALDDDHSELERNAALAVLNGRATGWLRTDLPDDVPGPWERRCFHWPLRFPEVFLGDGRNGFDATVGNPPFLGGKRISGANGVAYREHLVHWIADGVTGNADLVTYFLLRMCDVARSVGTLATNTISQGDTREVGLDRLTAAGWTIQRAVKSEPWPGEAGVEVAKLWLWSGDWQGVRVVDGHEVNSITPQLERGRRVSGTPDRLAANAGESFIGSFVNGIGFVMSPDEAQQLIADDARNADVLFPYLVGADLNEDPQQRPRRWVINFFDWPLERAEQYTDCIDLVRRKVKPERDKVNRLAHRERWWIYGDKRPALYAAVVGMDRVLAIAQTSKTVVPVFATNDQVFSHMLTVFAYRGDGHLGFLTSAPHWWWAHTWCSTMRSAGLRYNPTDAFENYPQPLPQSGPLWERIDHAGRELNEFRAGLMIRTNLGLTKTYNRVHDAGEHDPDVERLRELHVVLDHAVRDAYGWDDLVLDHHHWETPQGLRFTVGPDAKDELLDRLLELNHARYATEVAAGLHDKRSTKAARRPRAGSTRPGTGQGSMI